VALSHRDGGGRYKVSITSSDGSTTTYSPFARPSCCFRSGRCGSSGTSATLTSSSTTIERCGCGSKADRRRACWTRGQLTTGSWWRGVTDDARVDERLGPKRRAHSANDRSRRGRSGAGAPTSRKGPVVLRRVFACDAPTRRGGLRLRRS
jgi:hypothetical protein